jgi:integrase
MKSIRRSHVEAWVKTMSIELAPTTIKTRYVIVRSVFRAAVADRIIASDPSEGIALPRRRKQEAAMTIPTVNDVGRLVANGDSERVSTRKGFRAYVALCAFAGLRKGEAAAVQVGDIDFLRRQLTVSRQLQRDGSGYSIRPPKYGSERVVYLPDELFIILSERGRRRPRSTLTATCGRLPRTACGPQRAASCVKLLEFLRTLCGPRRPKPPLTCTNARIQ